MRLVLRFIFLAAVTLLVSPFLLTSLLVDQKGTNLQGQIVGKDEWITVGYSSWTRHQQIQVQYQPPDEPGLAVLNADLDGNNEQFDSFAKGQAVALHYLLAKDGLQWPGLRTMRQMHLLPRARLQTERTGSGLQRLAWRARIPLTAFALAITIIIVWRLLRLPFLNWLLAFCFGVAVTGSVVAQFPLVTPRPKIDTRLVSGTVKSIEVWKELFRSRTSHHTTHWIASEPIAVVGVQFLPEAHRDPVVAVDLIDAESVTGLKERSVVQMTYESSTPRTAQIVGARRDFVRKNFTGLVVQATLIAIIAIVLWSIAILFGRWYRNLIQSRR